MTCTSFDFWVPFLQSSSSCASQKAVSFSVPYVFKILGVMVWNSLVQKCGTLPWSTFSGPLNYWGFREMGPDESCWSKLWREKSIPDQSKWPNMSSWHTLPRGHGIEPGAHGWEVKVVVAWGPPNFTELASKRRVGHFNALGSLSTFIGRAESKWEWRVNWLKIINAGIHP